MNGADGTDGDAARRDARRAGTGGRSAPRADGGRLVVPAGRDVHATLDTPPGDTDRIVVACPPHPRMGGDRTDSRLRAVSDALRDRGVACLRIDYGPWDEGRGETADARDAVRFARERYGRVGLFGYSFGGAVAVLAAAGRRDANADAGAGPDAGDADTAPFGPPAPPDALAVLAPASRLGDGPLDAVGALDAVACPVRVVYGARDDTADWRPLVDRARELGHDAVELAADHHFVGQRGKAARPVAEFLAGRL